MGETTYTDSFGDLDLFAEERVFVPAVSARADIPADWEEEGTPYRPLVPVDHWPAKLPMELAMCRSAEEQAHVVEQFGLTPQEFASICTKPEFRRALNEAAMALRDGGYTFKMKCRGIAEDFLGDLDFSLHNREVGLSTKLDIFKTLTRLGDLEPAKQKAETSSAAPTVNIQINI